MKLDRNTNADGRGKYALVNLRALASFPQYQTLLDDLKAAGLLSYGNESPGDQFFVMKYKDVFTASGMRGYASAVNDRAKAIRNEVLYRVEDPLKKIEMNKQAESLEEYAREIETSAMEAATVEHKTPD